MAVKPARDALHELVREPVAVIVIPCISDGGLSADVVVLRSATRFGGEGKVVAERQGNAWHYMNACAVDLHQLPRRRRTLGEAGERA